MKALTLWQPWATLVITGKKRYETRSWSTCYVGPLAIHAGRQVVSDCFQRPLFKAALSDLGITAPHQLPTGCILGMTWLVRCRPTDELVNLISEEERAFGDWGLDRWAWRLLVIYQFRTPLPSRGYQGLWNWLPPESAEDYLPALWLKEEDLQ